MANFKLYSEARVDSKRTLVYSGLVSKTVAADIVENMDERGSWVVGAEAILVADNGDEFMLADDWEKI